jgi:hypothetical protein
MEDSSALALLKKYLALLPTGEVAQGRSAARARFPSIKRPAVRSAALVEQRRFELPVLFALRIFKEGL